MTKRYSSASTEAGFSLIELLIAMGITLVILGLVSSMLASSFTIRARETRRSQAIADAQRALNLMSREIANAGVGLNTNGIVAGDSNLTSIRIRSNLDAFLLFSSAVSPDQVTNDEHEDIKYRLINDANGKYLIRQNIQPSLSTAVFANPVDDLKIRYFNQKVAWTTTNVDSCDITLPAGAAEEANKTLVKYVVISVCVNLPEVGTPGVAGYQPPSRTQLVSDVVLRNTNLSSY